MRCKKIIPLGASFASMWLWCVCLAPLQAKPSARRPDLAERAARALVDSIGADVAKVRGLRQKRPFRVKVESEAGLKAFLERSLGARGGRRRLERMTRAFRVVGLLKPSESLYEASIQLLQAQVAGLYDPQSRTLKVMRKLVPLPRSLGNPLTWFNGSGRDMFRAVVAHELVHALQDQHWNLRVMAADRPGETDLEIAMSSVFEGDATLSGLLWTMKERGQSFDRKSMAAMAEGIERVMKVAMSLADVGLIPGGAALARAPVVLRERLMRPYVSGLKLCLHQFRTHGGLSGVDGLYRNPPLSMEQVLHPEKIGKDWPVALKVSEVGRLFGGKVIWRDTLGELYMRVFLREGASEQVNAAAEGWGGDRIYLIQTPKRDVVLWVVRWDSARDAAEFVAAAQTTLTPQRRPASLVRRGDTVWMVWGHDAARREGLVSKLQRRLKVTTRRRLPR